MKIPSLEATLLKAKETFVRFPIPVLMSIWAAILLFTMIELKGATETEVWSYARICLTLALAMPAFIAAHAFAERLQNNRWKYGAYALPGAYFIWFWFVLEDKPQEREIILFFVMAIAVHLLVSFAPFIRDGDMRRFWEYNKSIFLRILTSGLYSAVLFGGLALALVAIDELFDVNVKETSYAKIFVFISTVFNTWFFLAGFPKLNVDSPGVEYPKGLRMFTQFVLLPLVTIYLMILYAYAGKILFTMNWPRGWVSYLVIGFSMAGILALLLIWPLREDMRHKWIKLYARGFFFALFPLVILLFCSIYLRVSTYGITINRWFVILLACWLLLIALYFLLSREKQIRFIPVSLFCTALLSAYGPLSASNVAFRSQKARLLEVGTAAGVYNPEEGRFVKAIKVGQVDFDQEEVLSSAIEYLVDTYDAKEVASMFPVNADSVIEKYGRYQLPGELMKSIGLELRSPSGNIGNTRYTFAVESYNTPLDVAGYDWSVYWNYYDEKSSEDEKFSLNDSLLFMLNFNGNILVLKSADEKELARLNLDELRRRLLKEGPVNQYLMKQERLTLQTENDSVKVKLLIRSFSGKLLDNDVPGRTENIDAVLLVKRMD